MVEKQEIIHTIKNIIHRVEENLKQEAVKHGNGTTFDHGMIDGLKLALYYLGDPEAKKYVHFGFEGKNQFDLPKSVQ